MQNSSVITSKVINSKQVSRELVLFFVKKKKIVIKKKQEGKRRKGFRFLVERARGFLCKFYEVTEGDLIFFARAVPHTRRHFVLLEGSSKASEFTLITFPWYYALQKCYRK